MSETRVQPFLEVVRDWLRRAQPTRDVADVYKVVSYGTDWAGDTFSGFYDRADVKIYYRDKGGAEGYYAAEGEDLASLWDWVVKAAWPS